MSELSDLQQRIDRLQSDLDALRTTEPDEYEGMVLWRVLYGDVVIRSNFQSSRKLVTSTSPKYVAEANYFFAPADLSVPDEWLPEPEPDEYEGMVLWYHTFDGPKQSGYGSEGALVKNELTNDLRQWNYFFAPADLSVPDAWLPEPEPDEYEGMVMWCVIGGLAVSRSIHPSLDVLVRREPPEWMEHANYFFAPADLSVPEEWRVPFAEPTGQSAIVATTGGSRYHREGVRWWSHGTYFAWESIQSRVVRVVFPGE